MLGDQAKPTVKKPARAPAQPRQEPYLDGEDDLYGDEYYDEEDDYGDEEYYDEEKDNEFYPTPLHKFDSMMSH